MDLRAILSAGKGHTLQMTPPASHQNGGAKSRTQPEHTYNKTSGAADMAGELFEIKMLGLVFLRLVGAGAEFYIASNMAAAGLFDDIVVKHRETPNDPWQTILLQLKHKKNAKPLSRSLMLSLQGDFSLVKYSASYLKMKTDNNAEMKFFGNIDDYRFIIFTNSGIGGKIGENSVAQELLNTGGNSVVVAEDADILRDLCEWADVKVVLLELNNLLADKTDQESVCLIRDTLKCLGQFKNDAVTASINDLFNSPTLEKLEEFLKKLEQVRDRQTFTDFLGKLQFYTKQAHETKLDALITEELNRLWKNNTAEADIMQHAFLDSIKTWWRGGKEYLKQDSPLWLDLIKTQVEKLSRTSDLEGFGIDFEESHLRSLFCKIPRSGVMIVRVDSLTTVTSIKVMKAFDRFGGCGNNLHVDLATLLESEEEVLAAWSSRWCDRLVIECNSDMDQQQGSTLTAKITKVLCKNEQSKLVLLIGHKKHILCSELSEADCLVSKITDKCEWNHLTGQSQENLLSTNVDLQGASIVLSDVADTRFFSAVDLDVMSLLLRQDTRCGKDLEDPGNFFIARRLSMADGVPVSVNSVNDVAGKVVLVVAEPGMGKTTLMRQLAMSAKEVDPTNWVLHVQLNECTEQLQCLDSEIVTPDQANEFLEQFAFSTGNSLEKSLFKSLTRNVCVFIDGVDEVCPHYERNVLALFKCLKELDLKRLWVASRPICMSKLEVVLGVKTFHLVQFSNEDQANCITSVWKRKSPGTSDADLNSNALQLLNLMKQALGEDNPILGVPLMTILIAEIFQKRMISTWKTVLPKANTTIDVLFLYKSFVRKKFDVFYNEKKKRINQKLAANLDEEEINWQLFLQNHKLAALSVLFSTTEIATLNFVGNDRFHEALAAFVKEIAEGREKTGIIDNISADGVPHFVHRTFAEFFATTWLVEHYAANPEFTKRIIFNAEFRLMSDMFNSFLANKHPLHLAVINRDTAAIEHLLRDPFLTPEILANELDSGGRSTLHVAVFFNVTTQHHEYFNLVKRFLALNVRTNVADRVLGWRPWQYAEHPAAWPLMGLLLGNASAEEMALLKAIKAPSSHIFVDFIKQEDLTPPPASLLLSAASDAVLSVVRFLVEERGGDVLCRGPSGETMMQRAADGGNVEVVEYLKNKGVPLRKVGDIDGLTDTGRKTLNLAQPHHGPADVATKTAVDKGSSVVDDVDQDSTPLPKQQRKSFKATMQRKAGSVSNLFGIVDNIDGVNSMGHPALNFAHFDQAHLNNMIMHMTEMSANALGNLSRHTDRQSAALHRAGTANNLFGEDGDIDRVNAAGETRLFVASWQGRLTSVKRPCRERRQHVVQCRPVNAAARCSAPRQRRCRVLSDRKSGRHQCCG